MPLLKHQLEEANKMIEAKRVIQGSDFLKEHAQWGIGRWANKEDFENGVVYSNREARSLFGIEQMTNFEPNILLNNGITAMLQLLATSGATQFNNANAYLGVGDSTTAEVATQTALQATTNKLFKAMDSTYPQVSAQTVTFQSTYQGSEANFAWNEFGVANSSAGTVLLNRKVSSQGQKQTSQIWTLQLAMTMS